MPLEERRINSDLSLRDALNIFCEEYQVPHRLHSEPTFDDVAAALQGFHDLKVGQQIGQQNSKRIFEKALADLRELNAIVGTEVEKPGHDEKQIQELKNIQQLVETSFVCMQIGIAYGMTVITSLNSSI